MARLTVTKTKELCRKGIKDPGEHVMTTAELIAKLKKTMEEKKKLGKLLVLLFDLLGRIRRITNHKNTFKFMLL